MKLKNINYIDGLGTLLDIYPDTDYNQYVSESDSEQMRNDWEKIGNDFKVAVEKLEKPETKRKIYISWTRGRVRRPLGSTGEQKPAKRKIFIVGQRREDVTSQNVIHWIRLTENTGGVSKFKVFKGIHGRTNKEK